MNCMNITKKDGVSKKLVSKVGSTFQNPSWRKRVFLSYAINNLREESLKGYKVSDDLISLSPFQESFNVTPFFRTKLYMKNFLAIRLLSIL